MQLERREVRTDDATTISFLDSGGPGSDVVVLHGLVGSANELVPTALALDQHRVLLVDQRGHGHSIRRPGDVSRAAFVRDCVEVIEAECTRPVALVGQSMGAHTAMLVAAARPDLVAGLVLLECDEGGGDPATSDQLGDYLRSWPVPFESRAAATAFLGDGALQRAWVADLEERDDGLHPRFDPDVMVRVDRTLKTSRLDEWRRVVAPTLVVYAENGMFGEETKAAFVRAGRDVTRVDLAGASHDAHLDAFEEWIRSLRRFLGTP